MQMIHVAEGGHNFRDFTSTRMHVKGLCALVVAMLCDIDAMNIRITAYQ